MEKTNTLAQTFRQVTARCAKQYGVIEERRAVNAPELWVKWYAAAPVGYTATGVYCPSSDSYLFKRAS